MTALVWDDVGDKVYQAGVDHGVLYLPDGTAVAWNGLTEVEESQASERKSFYLDGVKFLENLTPGDFQGKLKAFTYPDEFDSVNGIANVAPGLAYYEQPPKSFSMSYRTQIGNDIEGLDFGYKIHILYNVVAQPDGHSFGSLQDSGVEPIEFAWTLGGTPQKATPGVRPTIHITIDSRTTPPEILQIILDKLYGTPTTAPSLPPITEIGEYFGYLGALLVIDHGDGTWSAIDESDTYITMLEETEFQIVGADATYLDPETYEVSSTNISSP
jgi:hypothetical protein